ncbi:YheT family hydrolase [Synechococcus sp. CS-1328]|uniref:YheT family hydrolase n=1 Tax=Synechococcus sp. CS-1328 TaxID=2847976 RepID=UPI00223AA3CA|nr:alpha/beta fold hydrolase [Synechococcus sp. CS-1328]MCT0224045.1 alpha/beta hydrolase [Synechococcus sp. CS-1328]
MASASPADLSQPPFRQRFPWIGGDLQTLRDTLHTPKLPLDRGLPLEWPVGALPCRSSSPSPDRARSGSGDRLLALLDGAPTKADARGLVLVLHGLGGSSDREGLRRMGLTLQAAGFAVLRLNLRGAGAGRRLAGGTYAGRCSSDLLPVIAQARRLAEELGQATQTGPLAGRPLPLLGAGISLGGTMLLNACLDGAGQASGAGSEPVLDGLVCISSPLDLDACSRQIERPRNRLYQRWLLERLCRQTVEDPFGVTPQERQALEGAERCRTIRAFDAAITAPRWGYGSVEHYYAAASPLPRLLAGEALPPTRLLHAVDDPWVPVEATRRLARRASAGIEVTLTSGGGHNGFHGSEDHRRPPGCWGDWLTARWLLDFSAAQG